MDRGPLLRRPLSLVRRLHQIGVSVFFDECAEFNITPLQYGILWTAKKYPGVDQTRMAELTALDRTSTARIVDNLRKKKLLNRRTGRNDRRKKLLYVTENGAELTELMNDAVKSVHEKVMEPLTKKERDTLQQLLEKLVDSNNNLSRAPGREFGSEKYNLVG